MQPEELASSLKRILERSPAFPEDALAVDLIANPRAGGFTRRAYAQKRKAELAELEAAAAALPARSKPTSLRLHLTERCGHAADIARSLLAEARHDPPGLRRLVLTAGGDGTSLETASALVELPEVERPRFGLLRLPMGTGNDGSEGRDLKTCLGRFLGAVVAAPRRALRILPNPAGDKLPMYSFNIASIGLDAFVSANTNKLKSLLPGDSYKLWVDIASVFYDRLWPVAPLAVRAFDAAGELLHEFERECLLFAVGASGRRQYGANIPILPDDDNACAVFQTPLLKKLIFKNKIAAGQHRGLDIVKLFSGERFELNYPRSILLQRDGEVSELAPEDFPLAIEISEPCYNVVMPV